MSNMMFESYQLTMIDMIIALNETNPAVGLFQRENRSKYFTFFSYRQIYKKIIAYMNFFRDVGIIINTKVIFPFESSPEAIISFLALIGLGAIPLSVKPYGIGSTKESYIPFLMRISNQYSAEFILDVPSLRSLEINLKRLDLPSENITLEHSNSFIKATSSDVAFVQFSSGSTSLPKGIPITHGNIMNQIKGIVDHALRKPDDVIASWLPLHHDMGLVGTLLSTIYSKHDMYISTPMSFLMNPISWLKELSKNQITITAIPDFAIGYCLRQLKDTNLDTINGLNLEKLRLIFNGGEPININNLHEFSRIMESYGLNSDVIKPCYGMAEAVLMVSCCSFGESPKEIKLENGLSAISVGKPLNMFDIRLTREDGHQCIEGEIGQIELKGGTLADKYFETDICLSNSDGFFETGDLGVMNEGELFVTGRLNDRFKVNAQSYFASDFEHAVQMLKFTKSGGVCAIYVSECITILVEVKSFNDSKLEANCREQIINIVLQQIGIKLLDKDIVFVCPGQLYKTSSGKLKRKKILQQYLQGEIGVTTT